MTTASCPRCGISVFSNAAYCQNCGFALRPPASPPLAGAEGSGSPPQECPASTGVAPDPTQQTPSSPYLPSADLYAPQSSPYPPSAPMAPPAYPIPRAASPAPGASPPPLQPAPAPQTTPQRAWSVAAGLAALLLLGSWVAWRNYVLIDPAATNDPWGPLITLALSLRPTGIDGLYTLLFDSPGLNDPFTQQLATLHLRAIGTSLLEIAPVAVAGSFWLTLRRLHQGRRSGHVIESAILSFLLLVVMLGASGWLRAQTTPGVLFRIPYWPYLYFLLTPGVLAGVVALAVLCGGLGSLFARLFAQYPQVPPGVRFAPPSGWKPPVFLILALTLFGQMLLFQWLHSNLLASVTQDEWLPLAALLATGLAAWTALE